MDKRVLGINKGVMFKRLKSRKKLKMVKIHNIEYIYILKQTNFVWRVPEKGKCYSTYYLIRSKFFPAKKPIVDKASWKFEVKQNTIASFWDLKTRQVYSTLHTPFTYAQLLNHKKNLNSCELLFMLCAQILLNRPLISLDCAELVPLLYFFLLHCTNVVIISGSLELKVDISNSHLPSDKVD